MDSCCIFFLKNPQANYFCRRKFLLVNGTHTTLAFMTLCLRQPRQAPNEARVCVRVFTCVSMR